VLHREFLPTLTAPIQPSQNFGIEPEQSAEQSAHQRFDAYA